MNPSSRVADGDVALHRHRDRQVRRAHPPDVQEAEGVRYAEVQGITNEDKSFLVSTELRKRVGTWLRDISSWPCLAFLPGPAWL